jgi:hypothetical protein
MSTSTTAASVQPETAIPDQRYQAELQAAFRQNHADVYVLDTRDFVELWMACQKDQGLSERQITAALSAVAGFTWNNATNIASPFRDAVTLHRVAEDMRRSGSYFTTYRVFYRRGKPYIAFRGYAGLRRILTRPSYGISEKIIVDLGIGPEGAKHAARQAVMVTLIVSASVNSIDGLLGRKTIDVVLTTFATDVVKAAIATAAGYLTGVALVAITGAATPVIIPLAVGGFVAIGFGWGPNELDKRYQVTHNLSAALARNLAQSQASFQQAGRDMRRYLFTTPGNVELISRISRMGR